MKKHLIVHIGTEKTGSTSIQKALNVHKAQLEQHQIAYAPILMKKGLGHARKIILSAEGLKTDIDDKVNALLNAYASQQTLILSHELFHSRLNTQDKVNWFAEAVKKHFDKITVICYFRDQVSVCKSLYSTALKSNNYIAPNGEVIIGNVPTFETFLDYANESHTYYNYYKMIKLWDVAFGKENLVLTQFSRSHFYGGDLIQDFFKKIGVTPKMNAIEVANSSLSLTGIEVMKLINANVKGKIRRELVKKVSELFSGKGPKMNQAQIDAIYNRFVASNKDLSDEYFNGVLAFEKPKPNSQQEEIEYHRVIEFLLRYISQRD